MIRSESSFWYQVILLKEKCQPPLNIYEIYPSLFPLFVLWLASKILVSLWEWKKSGGGGRIVYRFLLRNNGILSGLIMFSKVWESSIWLTFWKCSFLKMNFWEWRKIPCGSTMNIWLGTRVIENLRWLSKEPESYINNWNRFKPYMHFCTFCSFVIFGVFEYKVRNSWMTWLPAIWHVRILYFRTLTQFMTMLQEAVKKFFSFSTGWY